MQHFSTHICLDNTCFIRYALHLHFWRGKVQNTFAKIYIENGLPLFTWLHLGTNIATAFTKMSFEAKPGKALMYFRQTVCGVVRVVNAKMKVQGFSIKRGRHYICPLKDQNTKSRSKST